MEYILAPFAKWRGITKRKDMTRFSEQAWLLIYYLVFWPMGMVRSSERDVFGEDARNADNMRALVHILHVEVFPQPPRAVDGLAG